MTTPNGERRLAARHAYAVDVELHKNKDRSPMQAADVSRHGMFVACTDPAPLNHAVLLTVRLPGGAFETMATVVRRVTEQPAPHGLGMGLKLFCLGAEAKNRWDRFVALLEAPGVELPTRPPSALAGACFLVQPDHPRALFDYFRQNVVANRTLYLSPAIRMIGAQVQVVLVHPASHDEMVFGAKVVEFNPDHPLRMGIRFDEVTKDKRGAFLAFLGPVPGTGASNAAPASVSDQAPLLSVARPQWTEYAFYSPKLRAQRPADLTDPTDEVVLVDEVGAQSAEELDVIEGALLEHPALEHVDKGALFDFAWNNATAKDDD